MPDSGGDGGGAGGGGEYHGSVEFSGFGGEVEAVGGKWGVGFGFYYLRRNRATEFWLGRNFVPARAHRGAMRATLSSSAWAMGAARGGQRRLGSFCLLSGQLAVGFAVF